MGILFVSLCVMVHHCMSISVPSLWVSLWCTTTHYTVEILCMIVLYPIALIKLLSALTPMVKGLRDHPALAFWEVKIIQQIAVVSCHFNRGKGNIQTGCFSGLQDDGNIPLQTMEM